MLGVVNQKKPFFQSKKTFLPNDQKKPFLGSRKRFFLIDFDKKMFFLIGKGI